MEHILLSLSHWNSIILVYNNLSRQIIDYLGFKQNSYLTDLVSTLINNFCDFWKFIMAFVLLMRDVLLYSNQFTDNFADHFLCYNYMLMVISTIYIIYIYIYFIQIILIFYFYQYIIDVMFVLPFYAFVKFVIEYSYHVWSPI